MKLIVFIRLLYFKLVHDRFRAWCCEEALKIKRHKKGELKWPE